MRRPSVSSHPPKGTSPVPAPATVASSCGSDHVWVALYLWFWIDVFLYKAFIFYLFIFFHHLSFFFFFAISNVWCNTKLLVLSQDFPCSKVRKPIMSYSFKTSPFSLGICLMVTVVGGDDCLHVLSRWLYFFPSFPGGCLFTSNSHLCKACEHRLPEQT